MKPKHIETRVYRCTAHHWGWRIEYERNGRRFKLDPGPYTRRDSARRGARRAWERIKRGGR